LATAAVRHVTSNLQAAGHMAMHWQASKRPSLPTARSFCVAIGSTLTLFLPFVSCGGGSFLQPKGGGGPAPKGRSSADPKRHTNIMRWLASLLVVVGSPNSGALLTEAQLTLFKKKKVTGEDFDDNDFQGALQDPPYSLLRITARDLVRRYDARERNLDDEAARALQIQNAAANFETMEGCRVFMAGKLSDEWLSPGSAVLRSGQRKSLKTVRSNLFCPRLSLAHRPTCSKLLLLSQPRSCLICFQRCPCLAPPLFVHLFFHLFSSSVLFFSSSQSHLGKLLSVHPPSCHGSSIRQKNTCS
jgi:hypothetical protein